MTLIPTLSPRERILQAALDLLEQGGLSAVSTRTVSAAADVQSPTIYRQFGDMQSVLDAVAYQGFLMNLQHKQEHPALGDPIDDLRTGWDQHVAFGLAHPHLYQLMHGTSRPGPASDAEREAAALGHAVLQRVAEAGRLAVSVEQAAALIYAACTGLTLSLIRLPQSIGLSVLMRETVLRTIFIPEPSQAGRKTRSIVGGARQSAVSHAVALSTLLPKMETPFSRAEQALLTEWLRRLT